MVIGNSAIDVYGLLIVIGITSGAGDIFLYKWASARHVGWLLMAYSTWGLSLTLLGALFRMDHFSFGAAVVLATIIHLVTSLLWGLLFAESKMNNLEIAGLALALIAIILLEVGRAKQ